MVEHVTTGEALLRLLIAFALTYAIGFERELRGSPAGNRTFSLVGLAAALAGLFAVTHAAATAFTGVISGIGFIGAAIIVHVGNGGGLVRGLTTATTILAAAAVGSACGAGLLVLATVSTGLVLASLELRWTPGLRWLDANSWASRVRSETTSGGLAAEPSAADPDAP